MSYQEQTTQSQGQGIDEKLTAKTVLATLEADPNYRSFVDAAKSEGIGGVLAGPTLLTAFVPKGQVDNVGHYIVRKLLKVVDLKVAKSVKAMDGSDVPVRMEAGIGYFEGKQIGRADVACTNGMIHFLD